MDGWTGGHRKQADPGANALFLYKTKVWHYILLLTYMASNRSSSTLNQTF